MPVLWYTAFATLAALAAIDRPELAPSRSAAASLSATPTSPEPLETPTLNGATELAP
jgi:hypothetical protein